MFQFQRTGSFINNSSYTGKLGMIKFICMVFKILFILFFLWSTRFSFCMSLFWCHQLLLAFRNQVCIIKISANRLPLDFYQSSSYRSSIFIFVILEKNQYMPKMFLSFSCLMKTPNKLSRIKKKNCFIIKRGYVSCQSI